MFAVNYRMKTIKNFCNEKEAAMARTIRVIWRNATSGWFNFNWSGVITRQSVIHISACEGEIRNGIFGPLEQTFRMRGTTVISVKNIRPHPDEGGGGGVEFYVEITKPTSLDPRDGNLIWHSNPITLITDITVLDPPEQGVIV